MSTCIDPLIKRAWTPGFTTPASGVLTFFNFLVFINLFEVAETFTFTLDELEKQHGHDHDHDTDDHETDDHDTDDDACPIVKEPEVNPFADIPVLKDHARLDNCITVIDAVNFDATFNCGEFLSDRFEDATETDDRTVVHLMIDQIEFANVIVLNKIDMVQKSDLERIRKILQKLNPAAEVYATNYSKVPLSKVLNTGKFDFQEAAKSPGWLKELRGAEMVPESEEYGISSFIYHRQRPFVPRKIYDLMIKNFLLQEKTDNEQVEGDEDENGSVKDGIAARMAGPFKNVLRSKGFLWLATRPLNMGEWSQAGAILVVQNAGPWMVNLDPEEWPDEPEIIKQKFSDVEHIGDRRNEIVFIGTFDDSDRDEIEKALDACLVTDDQMDVIIQEGIDMDDPFESWFSILRMVDQLKTLFGQLDESDQEDTDDNTDDTEDDSDSTDTGSSDESEEEVFPWLVSRHLG